MRVRGASEWVVPSFAAEIVVATIVGLVVPLFTDVAFTDEEFARRLFPAVLGIVAIASPIQLRFLVLPSVLSGKAPGGAGSGAALAFGGDMTLDRIETSATTLVCAFALSDAIYGVVASILLDNSLWALPFGGLAMVSFATLIPWIRGRLEERRRELASEGQS